MIRCDPARTPWPLHGPAASAGSQGCTQNHAVVTTQPWWRARRGVRDGALGARRARPRVPSRGSGFLDEVAAERERVEALLGVVLAHVFAGLVVVLADLERLLVVREGAGLVIAFDVQARVGDVQPLQG